MKAWLICPYGWIQYKGKGQGDDARPVKYDLSLSLCMNLLFASFGMLSVVDNFPYLTGPISFGGDVLRIRYVAVRRYGFRDRNRWMILEEEVL